MVYVTPEPRHKGWAHSPGESSSIRGDTARVTSFLAAGNQIAKLDNPGHRRDTCNPSFTLNLPSPWWQLLLPVHLLSHFWLFVTPWLQHTRLPCLSLSPRICPNWCPLSQWCHPTISSSVVPFSCGSGAC